ncbi:hypothetical protein E2542_SST05358 [Spatholobus suberectus]|nr:hypothetical protein E2542_SST05358 [Spatholobus suberectus]
MAKPKGSSKPKKPSIFLCCFGSSHATESTTKGSVPISKMKKKKKTSWFSWPRIRSNKNSAYKTVPLEASIPDHAHYSKSKSKSKSTLHHKPQAPATHPPPPPQPAPVPPGTPYYTPSQTRHSANNVEDTRQQGRASPAHTKRQALRLSSSVQSQTTPKKAKNARSSYDPVVGMSVLVVTLVIMIFWGRLCAILCTSVWLYCTPRFRKSAAENDDEDPQTTKSNDVDLDSEEYKKRVIMEGLLERNHRANL